MCSESAVTDVRCGKDNSYAEVEKIADHGANGPRMFFLSTERKRVKGKKKDERKLERKKEGRKEKDGKRRDKYRRRCNN